MLPKSPQSHFRRYASFNDYLTIAWNLLLIRANKGNDIKELEQAIAHLIGADETTTLAAPQARVAIYLAVNSLIQTGRRKVILSPYTIPDVINMVICAGGVPVFVDIDRKTCNINPQKAAELIDKETGAVMVTHLFGLACEMKNLKEQCQAHNVPLIEEASHAFGTLANGQHLGTIGDAGIFSFGLYKNVNALYGGLLVTPHAQVRAHAATLLEFFPWMDLSRFLKTTLKASLNDIANHPWIFKPLTFWVRRYALLNDLPWVSRMGTQEDCDIKIHTTFPEPLARRMTPMQARILMTKLDAVRPDTLARIAIAKQYHHGLKDIPELILPPMRTDLSHGYAHYPIQCHQQQALFKQLLTEGRDISTPHLINCAEHTCFTEYATPCPNAKATAKESLLLPTYPGYTTDEVDRNIQAIRRFFAHSN